MDMKLDRSPRSASALTILCADELEAIEAWDKIRRIYDHNGSYSIMYDDRFVRALDCEIRVRVKGDELEGRVIEWRDVDERMLDVFGAIVEVREKNKGYYNAGEYNYGNYNVGFNNRGKYNIGSGNVGKCNCGDENYGTFNKGDYTFGAFNTEKSKVYLFNKETDMTLDEWNDSEVYGMLMDYMPKRYKETAAEYAIKTRDWWSRLDDRKKRLVLEMPNFDKKIFKEITGIDVGGEKGDSLC